MAVSGEECLAINDLNQIYQECKHCSDKWEEIGSNLGISYATLAIIKANNPSNCEKCMYQMLAKWLNKENEKCIRSWRSLCQALYSVNKVTANQIAEKHHVTDYAKRKELFHQTRSSDVSEIYPHIRASSRVTSQPGDHKLFVQIQV